METKGNESREAGARCRRSERWNWHARGVLTGTRLGREGNLTRDAREMGGSSQHHQFALVRASDYSLSTFVPRAVKYP
jgi:hypothetical protein